MSNVRQYHSIGSGLSFESNREVTGWNLEKFKVEKFWVDPKTGGVPADAEPYEVLEGEGNALMYGGAGAIWNLFIGGSVTPYDNSNAFLGVGDSTTATASTQTDLQAPTNKFFIPMDSGYPLHYDGTGSGAATIIYKGTAGTGDANFDWEEWGLFNASSAGRMANRKVESLGTKTAASAWTLTVVISIS